MITLNPNKKEITNASKFAKTYDLGGYGKNVLGVSHEEYIDFIRIGKLCELVFVRFLRDKNINVKCPNILTPCKGEHRKGADFILTHSNQSVDVKAANKPFHIRMLVREDQFKAHVHDVYIGAKYVSNNEIEFHGYLLGEDLEKIYPKDFGYGKCRHVLLRDLKSIEKFVQLCQNKEVII
ncbi:MAG: hypothetical protein WBC40_09060 [Halobacteriota archaeon]